MGSIKQFSYGRYVYEYVLVLQERKTISLIIEPCLTITVKAPIGTRKSEVEAFMQRKWMWMKKQLDFFQKYKKSVASKEYVSGESFYYLGRQYQLIVRSSETDKVALSKGKLTINTTLGIDNKEHSKKLLELWYRKRRTIVFSERYAEVCKKFEYKTTPKLSVRAMPKRWGSFVKGDKVVLNPLLIHAPKEAIDYVITHELCHMKYKNHDANFYKLLELKYPNWQTTKEKLELLVA